MDGIHVFLNAERGLSVLRALAAAGHGIGALHVPRAAASKPTLAEAARAAGASLEPVDDVNAPEFVSSCRSRRVRLAVVAGFSTIFKAPLLAAPELGTINCHAGRLPQYRGGSPLNWQIINGEAEAGISVIRMDGGINSGDVLADNSSRSPKTTTSPRCTTRPTRGFLSWWSTWCGASIAATCPGGCRTR